MNWGVVEGSCVRREYLITLGRLESLYHHNLAALGELKKSLLHQAFTGLL